MRWLPLVLLVACTDDDARPTVAVHVTDATGAPLRDAVVAAVCDSHGAGTATRTDPGGAATLVIFAADQPCTVTVSLPAFDPVQLADVAACAAACAPIEVALERVLP